MKKILVLLLLIFSASLFADVPVTEQPQRATPEEFLIIPCDNGDYVINNMDEYLRLLYEAGFNTSWFLSEEQFPLAKKHNLRGCLRTGQYLDKSIEDPVKRAEDWAKKTNKALQKFNKKDIFWTETGDEPFMKDLDKLSAISKASWSIGIRPYINLNPNYALHLLGTDSYEEYVDTFTKKCNLDYISYDNYSFDIDEGFQQDRYFSNMEIISKVAKENKVPFYNIISSVGHFNYMTPSDWTIELQGWTTIAYGGKGISYYTFIQPPFGNYKGAAYDNFGNITPTWYYIREMNMHIHSIVPVLNDLEHINTFHFGNVPKTSKGLESSQLLKDFYVETKVGTGDVVVGEFVNKKTKKPYIIIVNKDPKYSAFVCMPVFKTGEKCINILPCKDPIKWNPNKQEMDFGGENQWLASGRGMIIRGE